MNKNRILFRIAPPYLECLLMGLSNKGKGRAFVPSNRVILLEPPKLIATTKSLNHRDNMATTTKALNPTEQRIKFTWLNFSITPYPSTLRVTSLTIKALNLRCSQYLTRYQLSRMKGVCINFLVDNGIYNIYFLNILRIVIVCSSHIIRWVR